MNKRTIPRAIVVTEAAALKVLFETQAAGKSQESFGQEHGIGEQAMVWQYLNAHRPLNLGAALKFAKGLGVPVRDFSPRLQAELDSAGVAFRADEPRALFTDEGSLLNIVPVVGNALGGPDGYYIEIDYPTGHGDGYVKYPTRHANTYALRIKGDSMRPRIQPGEYVIVEPDAPCSPGDEVIVKTKSGKTMVKKLVSRRAGMIELLSINDDHRPITIDASDVEFMHFVAGIAKAALFEHER